MGLISFIKNAGTKIFKSEEKREEEKAQLILDHIKKFGFDVSRVKVTVDDEKVILTGQVENLSDKNKIIVTAGNINGISIVEDHLHVVKPEPVEPPEPEKQFYTVKKGDYLSKIAKAVYGDAMKYPVIFEANKPMLKDPNLIYPGQVLVIPPLK